MGVLGASGHQLSGFLVLLKESGVRRYGLPAQLVRHFLERDSVTVGHRIDLRPQTISDTCRHLGQGVTYNIALLPAVILVIRCLEIRSGRLFKLVSDF